MKQTKLKTLIIEDNRGVADIEVALDLVSAYKKLLKPRALLDLHDASHLIQSWLSGADKKKAKDLYNAIGDLLETFHILKNDVLDKRIADLNNRNKKAATDLKKLKGDEIKNF